MAKRDLELLFEIGCFRFVQRTWKRFLNPDFQNNTEHSFRVAWIALLLSKLEGVGDQGKILKMALIHDLPESRTGDVDYLSRQYVTRDENQAVEDMFKDTKLEDLLDIWKEFEQRKSIEYKIVKDADNLDVNLEIKEQEVRGFKIGSNWRISREKAVYPKLYTKSAKRVWREIERSNPHDWHLKGRNRFNQGDWRKDKKFNGG